jgi:Flp pilus assembly protein TadD
LIRGREPALAALPVLLAVAVYWRVSGYPFVVLDDYTVILRNPVARGGLSPEGISWAFTTVPVLGWIPLTVLSHLADVSLFGMDAGRHHLVNVLFHASASAMLFHVLRRMTGRPWESCFAAAIFAVHPLHVESVAWVGERKDVLCAFFWMLSIGAYVRYVDRPGPARYAVLALCFTLALLSKPMAVTLPFVLLLLDYWPLGRFLPPDANSAGEGANEPRRLPASRILAEKIPLLALSAAACVATVVAQRGIGAVVPVEAMPFWARVANAFRSWALYAAKTAWPSGLSVHYPHPGAGIDLARAFGAAALVAAATAGVVMGARRRRWLATGWFWFLGTLVPVIGLVQVGGQGMADRYAYIPQVGLAILVAWGAGEVAARGPVARRLVAVAAASWLALLCAVAWRQVGYWKSSRALFERAVAVTPDDWAARYSLGIACSEAGDDACAVAQLEEALRLRPAFPEAHNNLAASLLRLGRPAEALPHVSEALRLMPGFPEAHVNMGLYLASSGRAEKAIAEFEEALRLDPDNAEARHSLGMALARAGDDGGAIAQLRRAVASRPGYAEALNNLGVLLARRGERAEAAARFAEALRARPGYEAARRNLEKAGGR